MHALPCQHLMLIAAVGNGFSELPDSAISERWSMVKFAELTNMLENAVNVLGSVVDIVKLSNEKEMDSNDSDVSASNDNEQHVDDLAESEDISATLNESATLRGSATISFIVKKPKQKRKVVQVRLKRAESSDYVVLSTEEKYIYTQKILEPPLEHISSLETSLFLFYRELGKWRAVVAAVLQEKAYDNTSTSDTSNDLIQKLSGSCRRARNLGCFQ